jgi:hypothetical protein
MPDPYSPVPDPYLSGGQYPYAPRRRISPLLVAGLLMVLIGVSVGGYFVYTNRVVLFPPIIPAAPPPPISHVMAMTSPSPAPATASSPIATPSTEPSSPAPTEATAAAMFASVATQQGVAYHVDISSTVRSAGRWVKITMAMDESGADAAAVMRVTSNVPGVPRGTVHLVLKDGAVYGRVGHRSWQKESTAGLPLPQDAWAFNQFTMSQIEDVGLETHNGKELHHLRVPYTPAPAATSGLGSMGCSIGPISIDFWVRDNGVPVFAQYGLSCTPKPGLTMHATVTYEFSNWGQSVVIQLPKKFR